MTAAMLTAQQVQDLLDIDASTVYRMAQDGRLAAIRIGRQWRFPAEAIERLLVPNGGVPAPNGPEPAVSAAELPVELSTAMLDAVAHALGVMMVATDLEGRAITPIINPVPALARHADDPTFAAECAIEWRGFAAEPHLAPRFRLGSHGFECAHSLVRRGAGLVAMVMAGGVATEGDDDPDLYHLDAADRRRVLDTLPRTAAVLSRLVSVTGSHAA